MSAYLWLTLKLFALAGSEMVLLPWPGPQLTVRVIAPPPPGVDTLPASCAVPPSLIELIVSLLIFGAGAVAQHEQRLARAREFRSVAEAAIRRVEFLFKLKRGMLEDFWGKLRGGWFLVGDTYKAMVQILRGCHDIAASGFPEVRNLLKEIEKADAAVF